MTNFKEELRQELNNLCDKCDRLGSEKGQGIFIDQAISAITELVKGIVPEERYKNYAGSGDISWAIEESKKTGFNSCRSEILKRLD